MNTDKAYEYVAMYISNKLGRDFTGRITNKGSNSKVIKYEFINIELMNCFVNVDVVYKILGEYNKSNNMNKMSIRLSKVDMSTPFYDELLDKKEKKDAFSEYTIYFKGNDSYEKVKGGTYKCIGKFNSLVDIGYNALLKVYGSEKLKRIGVSKYDK